MFACRDPFKVSTRGRPEVRSKPLKDPRQGQDLHSHILMQTVELRLELVGNLDGPTQVGDYGLDNICCQEHTSARHAAVTRPPARTTSSAIGNGRFQERGPAPFRAPWRLGTPRFPNEI